MPDPDPPQPAPGEPNAPGTTTAAGQRADESQGRKFPCEECGADLTFEIGMQQLRCPYCGHTKELAVGEHKVAEQDYRDTLARLAERRSKHEDGTLATLEVRCSACGSTVYFTGTLTSTECAYCGSPIQREGVHESKERIPVDAVLPFLVAAEQANEKLRGWVRSRWFLPRDLRQRGVQGKLQGIYTPYYTYDAMTLNRYAGERGEHYTVTVGSGKSRRTETRTRWYPAAGAFNRFFDDVMVVASRGLGEKLLRALEPWPLARLIPFNPEVLAGYLARTYDLELDQGFTEAKQLMDAAVRSEVCRRIGGDVQRVHWINTSMGALTYKHVLLPVWLIAYRYRDRPYHIAINAGSGEVQGERPYDRLKIVLLILLLIAVVATVIVVVKSQS